MMAHDELILFRKIRDHLSMAQLSTSTGTETETIVALFDKLAVLLAEDAAAEDKSVILCTDGAARGNPGPAGIGVVIENSDGEILDEISEYCGTRTNNSAEYLALLAGLTRAAELGAQKVLVKSDSELLVRQIQGLYRVKNKQLMEFHTLCRTKIGIFTQFTIVHIPRSENKSADMLANKAIDSARANSS